MLSADYMYMVRLWLIFSPLLFCESSKVICESIRFLCESSDLYVNRVIYM